MTCLDGGQKEDEGEHHQVSLQLQEVLHEEGKEVACEKHRSLC